MPIVVAVEPVAAKVAQTEVLVAVVVEIGCRRAHSITLVAGAGRVGVVGKGAVAEVAVELVARQWVRG